MDNPMMPRASAGCAFRTAARTDASSRCVVLNDAAMLGLGTTTLGLIDRV
jgi:hypothetical protein